MSKTSVSVSDLQLAHCDQVSEMHFIGGAGSNHSTLNEGHKVISFNIPKSSIVKHFCRWHKCCNVLFMFDIWLNVGGPVLCLLGCIHPKGPTDACLCTEVKKSSFIKYSQTLQRGHLTWQRVQ